MSRIRIYSLRGTVYFYKWLNRFYKALLMTWHQDMGIAVIALVMFVISCVLVGITVYMMSHGIAMVLNSDTSGIGWVIISLVSAVTAKLGFGMSETMLPIKRAGEEQDEQDV